MKKYSACEDIYPAVECRDDSENRADIFNLLSIDGDAEFYIASEADKELRAALHSLWMDRAKRAQDKADTSFEGILHYRAEHPRTKLYPSTVFMPIAVAEWVKRWQWAERKCLQKAKEFANA